jgi:hypothetical protein
MQTPQVRSGSHSRHKLIAVESPTDQCGRDLPLCRPVWIRTHFPAHAGGGAGASGVDIDMKLFLPEWSFLLLYLRTFLYFDRCIVQGEGPVLDLWLVIHALWPWLLLKWAFQDCLQTFQFSDKVLSDHLACRGILQKHQARFLQIDDKNGDPETTVRRDSVGAVTVRGSAVELLSDPGHGDQSDGGGDDVELHVAQPRQVLQVGIAQKVNSHQHNNDLVHGRLLLLTPLIGAFTGSVMGPFRKFKAHHI